MQTLTFGLIDWQIDLHVDQGFGKTRRSQGCSE